MSTNFTFSVVRPYASNTGEGWFTEDRKVLGVITLTGLPTTRRVLTALRKEGYLSARSVGKVYYTDGTVYSRTTDCPLINIEEN